MKTNTNTKTAEAMARAEVAADKARQKALNKERNRLWAERRIENENRCALRNNLIERIKESVELKVVSAHFPDAPTDTYDDDGVIRQRLEDFDNGLEKIPGLYLTLRNVRGESLIADNLIEETAERVAQSRADEVYFEVFENAYRELFALNLKNELARPGRDAEIATDVARRDLEARTFSYYDYDTAVRDHDDDIISMERVEKVFDTVAERDAFAAEYDAVEEAEAAKAKETKAKVEGARQKAKAHLDASNNVVPFRSGDED